MSTDYGRSGADAPSGCQPSASASLRESSQSGIPNATLFSDIRMLRTLLDADIARDGRMSSFMVRAGLLSDILEVVESTAFRTSLIGRTLARAEAFETALRIRVWNQCKAGGMSDERAMAAVTQEMERVAASCDRSGEADETATQIAGSAEGESAVPEGETPK